MAKSINVNNDNITPTKPREAHPPRQSAKLGGSRGLKPSEEQGGQNKIAGQKKRKAVALSRINAFLEMEKPGVVGVPSTNYYTLFNTPYFHNFKE